MATGEESKLYRIEDLRSFAKQLLVAAQVEERSADAVVEGLVDGGSLRGVDSHGIRLLPHYLDTVIKGGINPKPRIKWRQKYSGFIEVDADNGFGQPAGLYAIDLLCEIANKTGIACAGVINSNHPGVMASYILRAANKGYIAFAFTNTGPKIQSTNAKRPYFGTNPVSFACPRDNDHPFCLDMATSAIPWNKVESARKTGKELPKDTAADADGKPTIDANKAESLIAAGGYKGYGLAAMVEILTTVLLGQAFGYHTAVMYGPRSDKTKPRRIGQFYIVMKLDGIASSNDAFTRALKQLTDEVRSEIPVTGENTSKNPEELRYNSKVMLPGDPEVRESIKRAKLGVPVEDVVFRELAEWAKKLHVPLPAPIQGSALRSSL